MSKRRLYFKVTEDEYELPIGVCTSSKIEKTLHTTRNNVVSCAGKYYRGKLKTSKYRVVEVEEDEE